MNTRNPENEGRKGYEEAQAINRQPHKAVPFEVPHGWTKGEDVRVSKSSSHIHIERPLGVPFTVGEAPDADDIGVLTFRRTSYVWQRWMQWWFS